MTDSEREEVVHVSGLSTRLNGQWILRDLNLSVYRGEVVGVIGESGSGKTLLIQQIIGLMQPYVGSVRVFGQPVHDLKGKAVRLLRRRWGVLFQQGALFSSLTVFDNVAFPLRELRKDGEHIDEEMVFELVQTMLHMVGLQEQDAWKYPGELSGGMTKRAALARALVLEPELLFLDEPGTGLDPISASALDELLNELRQDLQFTALIVTHDLNALAALSDRVALLNNGRILAIGTLEQVAAVDDPVVRRFFHHRRGEEVLRTLPSY
jgi:phospholipid/cholesterol/gamma-HCH transport system ATP-binding protein